jgi:S-methylmethionine-dependent homocysteine/selenocysteine methylase
VLAVDTWEASDMGAKITILDGGMGRELLRIGAPFRQPEWSALALTDGPAWVEQAHTNFIAAGAEIITTNSYAIVPFHIGEDRFANEALPLATIAGEMARSAANKANRRVTVAGSLPPLFGSYRPDLFLADDAARIIDPLIKGLSPFVDAWLGETLSSIAEAQTVLSSIARHDAQDGRERWISYSLHDSELGTLRSGEPVDRAVYAAIEAGATVVMFNCCTAESIGHAIPIASAIASKSGVRIGAYANRFISSHSDDGEANEDLSDYRNDLGPERYAQCTSEWVSLGASIIGGCCGITPEHISTIATQYS